MSLHYVSCVECFQTAFVSTSRRYDDSGRRPGTCPCCGASATDVRQVAVGSYEEYVAKQWQAGLDVVDRDSYAGGRR